MIQSQMYCYINGFLKWHISKKTNYIVGNKKFFGKICNLTDFIFNSKFYNQIDGVRMAIRSPLASVSAIIFMSFNESKWE